MKTLHHSSLNGLEMIRSNQEPVAVSPVCRLEDLCIDYCNNLRKLFTFNILRRLQSLRRLEIKVCEKVEEVFEMIPGSNVEER